MQFVFDILSTKIELTFLLKQYGHSMVNKKVRRQHRTFFFFFGKIKKNPLFAGLTDNRGILGYSFLCPTIIFLPV